MMQNNDYTVSLLRQRYFIFITKRM